MHVSSNKACYMGNISKVVCLNLFSNFSESFEVYLSRICREAGENHFWFFFNCCFFDCIIIKQLCFFIYKIRNAFE